MRLDLTEATARTAATMGVSTGRGEVVPPSSASFRRLRVELRENRVVGIPRDPFSCSAGTTDLIAYLSDGTVDPSVGVRGGGDGGSGGGGYGPGGERMPLRVAKDVREGLGHARARDVPGVTLADAGDVDPEATEVLRAP